MEIFNFNRFGFTHFKLFFIETDPIEKKVTINAAKKLNSITVNCYCYQVIISPIWFVLNWKLSLIFNWNCNDRLANLCILSIAFKVYEEKQKKTTQQNNLKKKWCWTLRVTLLVKLVKRRKNDRENTNEKNNNKNWLKKSTHTHIQRHTNTQHDRNRRRRSNSNSRRRSYTKYNHQVRYAVVLLFRLYFNMREA